MNIKLIEHNILETQAEAVIYFLKDWILEWSVNILDDNCTYQDFEKYIFIHKLGNALDEFIAAGDTFLNCYSGFCNAEICNYKCSGFSFIGTTPKITLILLLTLRMAEFMIFMNVRNQKFGNRISEKESNKN